MRRVNSVNAVDNLPSASDLVDAPDASLPVPTTYETRSVPTLRVSRAGIKRRASLPPDGHLVTSPVG
jgi:hypothetical protein